MFRNLLAMCVAFALFAQMQVIAAELKTKKVLVTNFYFGYHHDTGRQLNVALIEHIGREEGFEVEVVNSASEFTPDKLDGVQVLVIQNMTVADRLGAGIKDAIIEWNKAGGGIFTSHATLDGAGGEWNWLVDNCIYGHYVPHSDIVRADMMIDDEAYEDGKLHPMLTGLDQFDGMDMDEGRLTGIREEWFNWNNYFRGEKDLKILMNMDTDSYDCKCNIQDDHPAIWITEHGGGQGALSYNLLGHGGEVHECNVSAYTNNNGAGCNPVLKHFYKNAIFYHGGDLGGVPICEDPDATNNGEEGECEYAPCCATEGMENSDPECKNHQDDACIVSIGQVSYRNTAKISISNQEVSINYMGKHTLEVVNVNGETVFSKSFDQAKTYSLADLNTGIYFVKATAGNYKESSRIFVK